MVFRFFYWNFDENGFEVFIILFFCLKYGGFRFQRDNYKFKYLQREIEKGFNCVS